LRIRQIMPSSGTNAGGSGHYSFGTYLIQVVDASGRLANHGLDLPVTLNLHYGNGDSALDITHIYSVLNTTVPPCINLDPAASPGSAPSNSSLAALVGTVGATSTQPTTVDSGSGIITTSAPLASPTTSVTWGTDSPVATFGKPDPFEADLSGGSLTTAYNIDVPAGPKGFKPPLSLVYNSAGISDQHNPQGAAPWVGEGWNMTVGSISWAEHNVNVGGTAMWQDSWELSDAFGTSATLVPPTTDTTIYREDSARPITPSPIQWHTAPETYAKVFSYLSGIALPGTSVIPPCWRVFLANGIMEEFGCTADSMQYYPEPSGINAGKAYVSSWLLDLIIEPDGNQIQITYQRDVITASGMSYPRDAVLGTIQWDSPTCYDTNVACTAAGSTGHLWKPRMRVNMPAGHTVLHVSGSSCAPSGALRCDDPVDLSGSSGLPAPTVQSTYILNDIQVQISDDNSASWHTLRDYQLFYDQSARTTTTDPIGGLQESTAGKLTLNQIKVIGDDGTSSLPATNFTYEKHFEYYEDSLQYPTPATNCGMSWNTGYTPNPHGCVLWSHTYDGNSYYLATVSNGLGLSQTFAWIDNRDNMHGVPAGGDVSDPLYCTHLQVAGGGDTYPCDMVDDETWSRISLGSQTSALLRLTQAGQGGTQTSTPITGVTSYTYTDASLIAQECPDCVAGYSWGNQVDNDYLDFYNGKFMGFAQVSVSNPDGSAELHKFHSTEGWGVWSSTQVTIPCPASPPDVCHSDPWSDVTNAAHGREYEVLRYAVDGTTVLEEVLTTYAAICPAKWITTGSPAVSGYGNWGNNLVSPLDLGNPVMVCDIQTTQVEKRTYDGSASRPDLTTTYRYETGPCPNCFGRMLNQSSVSNDGGNSSPTTIAQSTAYIWNDSITKSSTTAFGPYLISFPAFSDTEDANGSHRYACTYSGYDQLASGVKGQNGALTRGDLTRQDRYTNCGITPAFTPSGPITTTFGYDNLSAPYGNPWWTNDADANAVPSITSHLGCTVAGTTHSVCTAFDGYFAALSTTSSNALNPTMTSTYQVPATATASGGFGIWPISTKDANNQTTTYTYDALGRQTSVTLPGETAGPPTQATTYTVWCSGSSAQRPCAEIDRVQRLDFNSSATITYRAFFDGMGHLAETRSPGPTGDIVQYYFYDKSQRETFRSIPYFVTAYLGAAGSLAYSIPDSSVAGTTYAYDALGRTVSVKDPLSQTTTQSYTVVCNAAGTGDSACYEQLLTSDALGHQTGMLTDALGRMNYMQAYAGNSPATYSLYATAKYTYDYLGDMTQIMDPDGVSTTILQFDMAGRQIALTDPDRGSETYLYDQDGNLTKSVDARGGTGTAYAGFDGIDRPIWRNTSNSPTGAYDTYSYDSTASGNVGVGRLTGETFLGAPNNALTGSYSYIYDGRGQQTKATLTVGAATYPLQTSYDDAGAVLTQTYPDGEIVTNTYGSQHWLTQVSTSLGGPTLLSGAAYSGVGGANGSMTSANLSATAYLYSASYDLLGRATDLQLKRSSDQATLFDQTRTFDAAGNVSTANTTLSTGTDHQAFCYDEQNRLTGAASNGTLPCATLTPGTLNSAFYNQSFAYDNMGRLTSGPLGVYSYGNAAHVHATTGIGSAYTAAYDTAGDMTCRAPSASTTCAGTQTGAQLTYNTEEELSNWQNQPTSPTSTAAFLYDGQGNRVAQQTNSGGSTTTTVYVSNVEEDATTGATTTKTAYYYANGLRLAMSVNGTVSYLASDGLGSASVTLDASGTVIANLLYAPYGSTRYSIGTMPSDHGFTGQIADSTSGLDYYGARYYDPVAGQFASADTVIPGNGWDIWGLSRYAYVEGNPVNRTDPTGNCTEYNSQGDPNTCWHGSESSNQSNTNTVAAQQAAAGAPLPPTDTKKCCDWGSAAGAALQGLTHGPTLHDYASTEHSLPGVLQLFDGSIFQTVDYFGDRLAGSPAAPLDPTAIALMTVDGGGGAPHPSTPVGRRGAHINVPDKTNDPATINGLDYSGHALDQMQSQGIVPSVVMNAIEHGIPLPGKTSGTVAYYDPGNNVFVVQNYSTGNIVTVYYIKNQ
jgi:RHS repeat-associated protein